MASTSKVADTAKEKDIGNPVHKLSENELERVTEVFKMYETGLREATIYPKDLAVAMKQLGLNPTETEIQDLINEVEKNGFIYYPSFCKVIMRKLREDNEENFRQELFRTLVGPKHNTADNRPAPLYRIDREFLSLEQFRNIMMNLPEYVSEEEIDLMFGAADKDNNGRITYREFKRMCGDPKPEPIPNTVPNTTAGATTTKTTTVTTEVKNGTATKVVETTNKK
ncbi:neo-calmodulin [Lepeophtheirus salmonis]|nr:calmodulin-2/4-like [Lepeophtheirus salmonis]